MGLRERQRRRVVTCQREADEAREQWVAAVRRSLDTSLPDHVRADAYAVASMLKPLHDAAQTALKCAIRASHQAERAAEQHQVSA